MNMKYFASVAFSICSLFFLVNLLGMYLGKRKAKTLQNVFFVILMVLSFLNILAEFFYTFCISIMDQLPMSFVDMSCKIYTVMIQFAMFFTIGYVIANRTEYFEEKKRKKYRLILLPLFLVFFLVCIVISALSSVTINEGYMYSFGGDVIEKALPICYVLFIGFIIALFIKNDKLARNHRLPLLFALIFIILVMVAQAFLGFDYNHQNLLITFLLFAIYFTIENQDFKLLEDLEVANKLALEANEAQTLFMEKMSHEIRSPMNTILGFSEALLSEDKNDLETVKEDVGNVHRAALSLLELVDNILDVSNIDSDTVELHESEYTLTELINNIENVVKYKLLSKNVSFSINVDSNLPENCYGDANLLTKIIVNTIINAFHYTNSGFVTLDVHALERTEKEISLEFAVMNSGHTMRHEDFNRDLNEFLNLKQNYSLVNGAMLGLMVAKSYVKLLNGDIEFINQTGMGTRYYIRVKQQYTSPHPVGNISYSSAANNDVKEEIDLSNNKVLIVDDNPVNIKLASGLFKRYNIDIDSSLSGEKCIEMIKNNKYDLVFLDVEMSGMNGLDTIKKVQQVCQNVPPIVALTFNDSKEFIDKLISSGFCDVIVRPVEHGVMKNILQTYLNVKSKEQELENNDNNENDEVGSFEVDL